MSLPNQLTMFRVVMIPVMVVIYLLKQILGFNVYWIMGLIFLLASFTDYLDGYIARKQNIVTTFGKFMDPLADKLLVMTALLILVDINHFIPQMWMPFWIPIVVLSRELIVTSIRLVAVGDGLVIAASQLGKYKTASTMAAITIYLFLLPLDLLVFNIIGWVVMGFSVFMTVLSGTEYFLKNKKIILQSK
jgi:CDP-diacylglycerol--glycerol-3-phosphate 3-phosphatidyltransferase